ncbi:MAG TPA: hypothetical protein VEL72_02265 [Ktedonobacteraceae bacterium]|nr:hypothetical protein [Ktedonobacteraceae bacterium]
MAADRAGRTALPAGFASFPTGRTAIAAFPTAVGADLPAWLPSIPTAIGTALVTGMAADRAGWAIIAAEFASLPTAIGAGLITGMAANRTGWAIIAAILAKLAATAWTATGPVWITISTGVARCAPATRYHTSVAAATAAEFLSFMAGRCGRAISTTAAAR